MRQDCKFGLGYSVYIGMYVGLSRKKKGGGRIQQFYTGCRVSPLQEKYVIIKM